MPWKSICIFSYFGVLLTRIDIELTGILCHLQGVFLPHTQFSLDSLWIYHKPIQDKLVTGDRLMTLHKIAQVFTSIAVKHLNKF